MSNHVHLIWQVQKGFERENVQRDFLKFTSQTIKRDLKKNHPAVLQKFLVSAKDRKYPRLTGRAGNMGTQSLKRRVIDKRNIHSKDELHSLQILLKLNYAVIRRSTNIHQQNFMKIV